MSKVDRPGRRDDGSPARLIAVMVGIVGILLLGSLAWSAVGALFSALGEATSTLSTGRPTPTRLTALVGTPTAASTPAATPQATPEPRGTATPNGAAAGTPTLAVTLTPVSLTPTPGLSPTLAPTLSASARAPWILLPQPAPDSRVTPGPLVIEARGRGDTPITTIRLDLDGAPLPVSLEQRSESTWRGFANAQVTSGRHAVHATVVDQDGRIGGFRWTFEAGP